MTDLATAAQEFFAAYDAHDVEGMTALCADGARGRYAPYGCESVVSIRGGIDVIWRAFQQAVPNFRGTRVQIGNKAPPASRPIERNLFARICAQSVPEHTGELHGLQRNQGRS